jgi:hypothetical protein
VYFPAQLGAALGLDDGVTDGARLFLAEFRQEAGSPTDPVERLLVDQLALTHLVIARLQAQAAEATQLEFKKLYFDTGVRLLGEIRQGALALQSYRNRSRQRGRRRPAAARAQPDERGAGHQEAE